RRSDARGCRSIRRSHGPGTTGVHDALGDALMVEVGDLLAKNEVLEQRRSADPRLERGLVIGDQHTLVGGQRPHGCQPNRATMVTEPLKQTGPPECSYTF